MKDSLREWWGQVAAAGVLILLGASGGASSAEPLLARPMEQPSAQHTRPIEQPLAQELDVEILSPEDVARAAIAVPIVNVREPQFELIGRVLETSRVAVFTIYTKEGVVPLSLDENGQFKAFITLASGENNVTLAAYSKDNRLRVKTLRFSYDGDLERFATQGSSYALVIGIENYDRMPRLETPLEDAHEVAQVLAQQYGFKTELKMEGGTRSLLLDDASLSDINNALRDLRRHLTENDALLIYFAGHGEYLGENEEAYWIPKDGEKDDNLTWLSAHSLISTIKLMSARSVLIVSDSCFSGAMTREPPDLSAFDQDRRRALLKQGSRRSRIFISSGGTEPVLDKGCAWGEHSVFACAFLAALREAKQPIFSSGELHHMELLPRVGGTTRQQPQRKEIADSNHDNGDFIFVREMKVTTAAGPQR